MRPEEIRQGAVEYAKTHNGVLPKMGFVSTVAFRKLRGARDRRATVVTVGEIPIYEMPRLKDYAGVVFVGLWWGWTPVGRVNSAQP